MVFLCGYLAIRLELVPKENNTLSLLVFIGFLGGILIGSMVLWGKVLVLMGILTKDEAKGYPYSKPWENRNIQ